MSRQQGVRLLDARTSGGSLTADSRAAVSIRIGPLPRPTGKDLISQCWTNWIVTPDGSSVACEYSTTIGVGSHESPRTTMGFVLYSTRTGKMARVTGVSRFAGLALTGMSLWWVGPEGKTLIARVGAARGGLVGVVSGETFTPLPGAAGLGPAAW